MITVCELTDRVNAFQYGHHAGKSYFKQKSANQMPSMNLCIVDHSSRFLIGATCFLSDSTDYFKEYNNKLYANATTTTTATTTTKNNTHDDNNNANKKKKSFTM